MSLRRIAEYLGYVAAITTVLAIGVYQGLQVEMFTLDLAGLFVRIVTVEAVPSTVFFSILVTLSGVMLAREVYTPRSECGRVVDGPRVMAIIPVYQDAAVLQESVESLLNSNYQNLDIAIVCEPDDDPTWTAAREYADNPRVQLLENHTPGSKSGAVNDAVSRLDADYFAVFDADERIDPEFIPIAMHNLTEGGQDVFQARRVPRVTGAVEGVAYCERLLFHAGYKMVEPLGFTSCRSSSTAFTREAFETVGGLDHLLTEDLDFAHKCFRADLNVRQARNVTNEMEAPHSLRDLWMQRKRWRLGHIQILNKALRFGYTRGGVRGKLSTLRILSTLATTVFLLTFIPKALLLLIFDLETFFLLPFAAIAVTAIPIIYHDYQRDHIVTLTPAMTLVPLVYPGYGLLTLRCAFEYVLSWSGEWYQVEKDGT